MKKIGLFLALLVLVCPLAFADETEPQIVFQMSYILKTNDGIQEGTYTGETKNGRPDGYGVFETEGEGGTPWHYLGNWADGVMFGQGGKYYDDGQAYVGEYEANGLICGYHHKDASYNHWIDYRMNEHGCQTIKIYRPDNSLYVDCCISPKNSTIHLVTIYTKDGKVFLSGEIGEGFDWSLLNVY